MDRLLDRAGKQPLPVSEVTPTTKTKAEAEVEVVEPEPTPASQPGKGGLGGLLGGWWGRK
jgi:signal recognition particle subunit SRP68